MGIPGPLAGPMEVTGPSHRRILIVALALLLPLILLGATASAAAEESTQRIAFPWGSFVIPMDEKQADLLHAFGLVHSLLRDGVPIYRVLGPPEVRLATTSFQSLDTSGNDRVPFSGGPILVWRAYRNEMDAARAAFPSVTVDTLYETTTLTQALAVREPTRILIIKGPVNWGKTEVLLDDMGIPYDLMDTDSVEADLAVLASYNLIVDDCPGWDGKVSSEVAAALKAVPSRGDHLIFTDRSLQDLKAAFPGRLTLGGSAKGTYPSAVHARPESPTQFPGGGIIDIYTETAGRVIKAPPSYGVRVVLDTGAYPLDRWDPAAGNYRILAAYFFEGLGTVEGFAYHPQEQSQDAYVLASVLYGNRFVHTGLVIPPPPPPTLPLSPPLPATVPPTPPPPPPPALAVPAGGLAQGLAAGLVLLPVAAGLRVRADRLRPRVRVPVTAR